MSNQLIKIKEKNGKNFMHVQGFEWEVEEGKRI